MLSARESRKGYWMEKRATIPCMVWPDGLLVAFRIEDAKPTLDGAYPFVDTPSGRVWYFNDSLDREIAEERGYQGRIIANPQILWTHFLPKVDQ